MRAAGADAPAERGVMRPSIIRWLGGRMRDALTAAALVLPVTDGVAIHAFPDVEDQTLALTAALRDGRYGPITILLNDRGTRGTAIAQRPELEGVRFVPYRSVQGVIVYARSRVRFTTHGSMAGAPTNRQALTVNVWHGMPVKTIGRDAGGGGVPADLAVATSDVFRPILSAAWDMPEERVHSIGIPRNDRLLRSAQSSTGPAGLGLPDGQRLVMLLPTWRATNEADIDATAFGTGSDGSAGSLAALDAAIEGLGLHCVVKPHPLAGEPEPYVGRNVRVITDRDIANAGVSLYELLGRADILVTDYSSVWIDYLLLDRPIVFHMPDETEYRSARGVYFDDLHNWVPGPVVSDLPSLVNELTSLARGEDEYAAARVERRAQLHAHIDARSTERLLAQVDGLLDQLVVGRQRTIVLKSADVTTPA